MDSIILYFDEVIIKDRFGNGILAYKVSMYQDSDGVFHDRDIPDHYKSNCHGYAMGLDLWITDFENANLRDPAFREDYAYRQMMERYTVPPSDATIISFYHGDTLTHSIRTNPTTGEVWSTTDHGLTEHFDSLDDFFNHQRNGDNTPSNGEIYGSQTRKYYKPE